MKMKTIRIRTKAARDIAIDVLSRLPIPGFTISFGKDIDKRTLKQNRKMWAMLTDISNQVIWYGERYAPEDWKHIMTASLRGQRAVPGINGGAVVLAYSTSRMTIDEMGEVIEACYAFGADPDHLVKWTDPNED